ncbi:DUF452 family protein [Plebeiibacterium sediminum]|uniref:DUF452 family protein n=1 Tax=Plebeiibacterium sediminum TaxID=2992112 RepID=A0AAE3SHJ4_9BACT|nr:pimeloyl-ACP methyl esterase BioG family protein [Plebeiobacterium sediminum]MCW3789332.1 DUF452 family protein [Plebeiobacterium sediminum]
MKYKWINNQNNSNLILFFNGWGCDEHQVKHLKAGQQNVLMIYDYTCLHLDEKVLNEINNYPEVSIIAWSFGVWMAQYISKNCDLNINKAIAINGTLQPVHDKFGISKSIVQGTYEHLSERNLMKFQRRMVGGNEAWKQFEANKPQRTFENQKEELGAVIQHFDLMVDESSIYNKAIIGTTDLIFTCDNQKSYWKDKAEMKEINSPHFCFYRWNAWSEILI